MQLDIIKTSSSGNFFTLRNDKSTLLIECGVTGKEIKKALDFDFENVCGCLVTHEHGDHAKGMNDVLGCGIPVYASMGTFKALGIIDPENKKNHHNAMVLKENSQVDIGGFRITALSVEHDAAEPLGFIITDIKTKTNVLFVTDTYYLRYKIKNVQHYIIECNYDEATLIENEKDGLVDRVLVSRIRESHMSLETLCEVFENSDINSIKSITLIHASSKNLNDQTAIEKLATITNIVPTIASSSQTLMLL